MERRTYDTKVTFHAVSCELNPLVCVSYSIDGFPTVLGWRGGTDYIHMDEQGASLNGDMDVTVDSIAFMLGFDVAQESKDYEKESKYSNSEDQRQYEESKVERAKELAKHKTFVYESDVGINARYHDAAVSLVYALRNGVYTGKKNPLEGVRAEALFDFFTLVHWASPSSWNVRNALVGALLEHFHDTVVQGRQPLLNLIEPHLSSLANYDTNRHTLNRVIRGQMEDDLLWGYIDEGASGLKLKRRMGIKERSLGLDSPERHGHDASTNMDWTEGCRQGHKNSGFPCGLWELFHILSVGASQPHRQLYAFHKGYTISSHEVAETIRNFIANFFMCEICRKHFLDMYDNCGHDHCHRLSSDVPLTISMPPDKGQIVAKELPIWLWEVHNAGKHSTFVNIIFLTSLL
jgi:hypothetical protein